MLVSPNNPGGAEYPAATLRAFFERVGVFLPAPRHVREIGDLRRLNRLPLYHRGLDLQRRHILEERRERLGESDGIVLGIRHGGRALEVLRQRAGDVETGADLDEAAQRYTLNAAQTQAVHSITAARGTSVRRWPVPVSKATWTNIPKRSAPLVCA